VTIGGWIGSGSECSIAGGRLGEPRNSSGAGDVNIGAGSGTGGDEGAGGDGGVTAGDGQAG